MGTTTNGIPYPEPSDPVAQGAAAIKAVAQAVDPWKTTLDGKVAKAGDTLTGQLSGITPTSAAHLARKDYVDGKVAKTGDTMTGGLVVPSVMSTTSLVLGSNGAEAARFDPAGSLYLGKTGTNFTDSGFVAYTTGVIAQVADTTASSQGITHIGAADANATPYASYRRTTSGTTIGSITQTSTTGVAFNTTSHGPWKGDVADADTDAAAATVAALRPVTYRWKFDPDGNLSEHGTPSGDIQLGFIAQDLVTAVPAAVTVGSGTEADGDLFQPWQVDYSRLVPTLTAALQAALARIDTLAARVAALEGATTS